MKIDELIRKSSPMRSKDFVWGVATSSFQIEGAANHDGRLESIWDSFCKERGRILDGSNGDQACDHYHLFDKDLDLIKSLGFSSYRFSVAWPRVVDINGNPNELGLSFYESLIEGMLTRGIEPMLTLYHWDLPEHLQQIGGWTNPDVQNQFADYAALVMERFGDRVKFWATLNEPWCSSFLSFDLGIHAPGKKDRYEALQVGKGLLLGHAKAMIKMRKLNADANLGIVINPDLAFAFTESDSDELAANIAQAERNDFWFAPLSGSLPPSCLDLPNLTMRALFSAAELELIKQPLDFVGVNYYTRSIVKSDESIRGYAQVTIPNVERTHIGWEVFPDGLETVLKLLHKEWPQQAWYITENGAATDDTVENGECLDQQRLSYFQTHLAAVDRAIEAGVPVKGYYAWSLMDNFEWAEGYTKRFGIVHVDFETQKRTAKQSALAFKEFLKSDETVQA